VNVTETRHQITPERRLTTAVKPEPPGQSDSRHSATRAVSRSGVDGKFLTRDGRRFRVQGVTYGPFAPDSQGNQFPPARQVRADFAMMRDGHVNTIRTYHPPPDWFLELAAQEGLGVLVDVPWPKHLCFLDNTVAQSDARRVVRATAERGRRHPSLLAYSIGNEIPASVVRWHGAKRVEQFLGELADVCRQADPDGLITYANYPPTEYLDLPFLDFATFNVYLHDVETFRRYLLRLHNLVGERPLLLGELGMDTLRNGELAQADHLQGHLREALMAGTAGAVVFSWTDDWHTGGHAVTDWAFGVTDASRNPKPAYHVLREEFGRTPAEHLTAPPRVSVVVCSYNGGRTLDQCLRSLAALDYPDFEVILVDDGSTDDTRVIAQRHPAVRVIHQPNAGLSAARNAGLRASTGTVVAYTDSDCFADRDWLTFLTDQLRRSGAAAVGGPNLTPDDGWLAGCVAAAPGQPTHVLESDQVAEHIPGCNMAFRREALEAINGFDPVYRKAGDDVDVCWRLQQAGHWITYAPAAFVWHHRRQGPRAYLRQQAGYGEAEGLLRFKHPDRFNSLGDGKWRGELYGAALKGVRLGGPIIYRGVFATGLFQCVYRRGPAHWAMLPSTLEWHALALVFVVAALAWTPAGVTAIVLLGLSCVVAVVQAAQANLPRCHRGVMARLVVGGLCYAQPLVRSWKRYVTRLFSYCPPARPVDGNGKRVPRLLPLNGRLVLEYWTENGRERTELLASVISSMNEHRWGMVIDTGWSDWDLRIDCYPWTVLQLCTAEEDHGGGRRLIRIRYVTRAGGLIRVAASMALVSLALVAIVPFWIAGVGFAASTAACVTGWWQGLRRASAAVHGIDELARRHLGMVCVGREAVVLAETAPEALPPTGTFDESGTGTRRSRGLVTVPVTD
jgi:GT2 family glycosyltransferase